MKIGIDASRAFLKNKTGIEEYSLRMLENLRDKLNGHQVVLYTRKNAEENGFKNFRLPDNWKICRIDFNRFWTQIGLAFEILFNPVDVLFVPAHTLPWIHPKKSFVTVHGLEYEKSKNGYSFYSKMLHRYFIKKSCKWAEKIIAVSQTTKQDLIDFYNISPDKIEVVFNGVNPALKAGEEQLNSNNRNHQSSPFVLFLGRLERRKNIKGIIETFEILKDEHRYSGKLILAGMPGQGYEEIKSQIKKSRFSGDIVETGYVSEKEKNRLLKNADVFFFPSLCEGFGIPILEAQLAETPVITSNFGPMNEVAGNDQILADPKNPSQMAKLADRMIKDENFKQDVIAKGRENVKRFSWSKSAEKVKEIFIN